LGLITLKSKSIMNQNMARFIMPKEIIGTGRLMMAIGEQEGISGHQHVLPVTCQPLAL